MAIPFNLPDEVDSTPTSTAPPQLTPIDIEALIQALCETLCRHSQERFLERFPLARDHFASSLCVCLLELSEEILEDDAFTPPSTPSRSAATPANSNDSQIDNEALLQAFCEALCRCSRERVLKQFSPAPPSPSTSSTSSPRSSFRSNNSQNISSLSIGPSDDENEDDLFTPDRKPKKDGKRNKFTNFVKSSLKFVIDTFK